jgi:ATP-dependent RNA helicase DeaD
MEFSDLGISSKMVAELLRHGFTKPTNVQEKVIPLVLDGKDVIVQSETGSGKTISFACPTIDLMLPNGLPQILVLAPTRELALQISEEFYKLSRFKNLKIATVYGGASFNPQIRAAKEADVIIGTPGRLLDFLSHNQIKIDGIKYLILDEADRLLDMGFINDLNEIIKHLPKERQSLMFSATINKRITELSSKYMKYPEKIILNNVLSKNVMTQFYYDVETTNEKNSLLVHLLKKDNEGLKLVFCNTKRKTLDVSRMLKDNGIKAGYLNGDMNQSLRERRMKEFYNGYVKVLVATDIAARGLDIDGITHVYNYNLPHECETYSHRIGRTARNGKKGVAVTLLSREDYNKMDELTLKHRCSINKSTAGNYERVIENTPDKFYKRGFNKSRKFRR